MRLYVHSTLIEKEEGVDVFIFVNTGYGANAEELEMELARILASLKEAFKDKRNDINPL